VSIFIVDDSPLYRKIIEDCVAELKFGATESFDSGEAVLERLKESLATSVQAILLDILMPGMDGIECCLRIRALPGYADTPILMVTAFDDEVHMLCGFEAGATDYIKKPIQKYNLQVRLRNSIQLYDERARRLEYERRLKEDVVVAQEVQGRLLTTRIDDETFRMDLLHRPAANLSGDMVYVCPLEPGRYAALLIDVMGHGISAALIAVLLQSTARELFFQQPDPGAVLTALSRQMWDITMMPRPENDVGNSGFPSFFSAVCFDFNLSTRCLKWVNAGHVPVLLKQEDAKIIRLESGSPPLGLMPDMHLQTNSLVLSNHCRLLAFSDGILDNYFSSTATGIEFLEQTLSKSAASTPHEFLTELDAHLLPARSLSEMDDLCVMTVDVCLERMKKNV
jgi:sigma-B regulation protein RsbU (phosphoserine phosphatase)